MKDSDTSAGGGQTAQDCPQLPTSAPIWPSRYRLCISKPQHQVLLTDLAHRLGTNRPQDALEHVLNCWIVGNVPPPSSPTIQAQPIPSGEAEFDGLLEY